MRLSSSPSTQPPPSFTENTGSRHCSTTRCTFTCPWPRSKACAVESPARRGDPKNRDCPGLFYSRAISCHSRVELDGIQQQGRLQPIGMIANIQRIGIWARTAAVLYDQQEALRGEAPRTSAISPVEIVVREPTSGWLWNKGAPDASPTKTFATTHPESPTAASIPKPLRKARAESGSWKTISLGA